MSKFTLTIFAALLTLTPLSKSSAQETATKSDYRGEVISVGIGLHTSATYWYWYNSTDPVGSREHYPIHVHSRTILSGSLEKRSILKIGRIAGNLKFDGLIGFWGGTKEDWLPLNETISDGGLTYGLNFTMKFVFPTRLSPTMPIAPYAGIGLQDMAFRCNGSGVGTDFANRVNYAYENGWSEWILAFPVISIGIDFEFGEKFVISPEYRFLVSGWASTDWAPVGNAPVFEDVTYGVFSVSIGRKF